MSGIRHNAKAAPAAPAAGKQETFYDSTTKRLRAIDEKGMKADITGGMDSLKLLINAGFKFAQRQTPGTLTSYTNSGARTYAADRWAMVIETASLQYARVDTVGAFETGLTARFYGQYKQITGAGKFVIQQWMEASRCMHLRGKQVRFQLMMKASSAKTIRIGLRYNTGTVDAPNVLAVSAFNANTVDPTMGNTTVGAPDLLPLACYGAAPGTMSVRNGEIDCSVTGAWQSFGGIFTIPTTAKNVAVSIWTDSQFAINDILNISQVTLLNQVQDCDWNEMPDEQDLEACQRFYVKSFPIDVAPAQNAGLAGAVRGNVAVAGAVAAPDAYIRFPVVMRANPNVALFNPSAANAFARNVTAATDATATAAANISDAGAEVSVTGLAAWTVAQSTAVHYRAEIEL